MRPGRAVEYVAKEFLVWYPEAGDPMKPGTFEARSVLSLLRICNRKSGISCNRHRPEIVMGPECPTECQTESKRSAAKFRKPTLAKSPASSGGGGKLDGKNTNK
jgi:hypothetical protein